MKQLESEINLNRPTSNENVGDNKIGIATHKPKRSYTKIKDLSLQQQIEHKKMINRKKQSKYRKSNNGKIVYENYRKTDHAKSLNAIHNKKYRDKKKKEIEKLKELKIVLELLINEITNT